MYANTPTTGRVLSCQTLPGDYHLLRLTTELAADLQPGHALRIADADWPVLQTTPEQGWVDCLRRGVSAPDADAVVPVAGPVSQPFELTAATARALLLADDDGLASAVFLARALRGWQPRVKPFALFELTPPLPFRPQPSRIMTPGLPAGVIAALPLLEDWKIPSRIACRHDEQPGCFIGAVTELAAGWLGISQGVADVTIFASGGDQLLAMARNLADVWQLACQLRPIPLR